jgi:ATP-dependent RNA helicase RhlE
LDEADRMLDMGFINDIRRIMKLLPSQRQTLMFSATFSDDIRKLAKTICRKPVEIDVAPRNSTVEAINQRVYAVDKADKIALLSTLLRTSPDQALVFSRTKHGANKLVKCLHKDGLTATAIHGNKSQKQRTKALDDFKTNRVQVMVATDIAARGIDIDRLAQVINFDLPNVSEDYVHRIGRTGRAGASGLALSLVSPEERGLLRDIERLIKRRIEQAEVPEFSRPERIAPTAEALADNRQGNNQAKSAGSGTSKAKKRRRTGTGNAANDTSQEARPDQRRRSRNKKRNSQNGTGTTARQSKSGNTPQGDSESVARIKRFFGGKKVA